MLALLIIGCVVAYVIIGVCVAALMAAKYDDRSKDGYSRPEGYLAWIALWPLIYFGGKFLRATFYFVTRLMGADYYPKPYPGWQEFWG